jgi:hypothetical protein
MWKQSEIQYLTCIVLALTCSEWILSWLCISFFANQSWYLGTIKNSAAKAKKQSQFNNSTLDPSTKFEEFVDLCEKLNTHWVRMLLYRVKYYTSVLTFAKMTLQYPNILSLYVFKDATRKIRQGWTRHQLKL